MGKESDNPKSKEIAKVENDDAGSMVVNTNKDILSLDVVKDMGGAMSLMAVLSKGKVAKDLSPEELITRYLKAKELGLGFVSAADHMHTVKGKTGVDIHIIKALLLKAGSNIWWEVVKDFEPQYQYTDGSNTWIKSANDKPEDFLPRECMYVYDAASTEQANKVGRSKVWKVRDANDNILPPVDYITTYKFYREVKSLSGVKIITAIGTFSWLEAIAAKLPMSADGTYSADSNWQKYRKLMIDHRAFTFGGRSIAADLLLGLYETKELYDMNNIKYTVDAEAVVVKD